jgi:hypothetical protein
MLMATMLRFPSFSALRLFPALLSSDDEEKFGFVSSSLGIERRMKSLGGYWRPHLENSKNMQRRWLSETGMLEKLAILGAGRLNDVAIDEIGRSTQQVHLYDADPLALHYWRKWRREKAGVHFHRGDMSNCLAHWITALEQELALIWKWEAVLAEVSEIPQRLGTCPGNFSEERFDGIVSLNVASQLPIGWQIAVEKLLLKKFSGTELKKNEEQWISAVGVGGRLLVERHLADIAASGASSLIITDVEILTYNSYGHYSRYELADPPVSWLPIEGKWSYNTSTMREPPLSSDPLYGATVESPFKGKMKLKDEWLWHISPQGIEQRKYGELHRVQAYSA